MVIVVNSADPDGETAQTLADELAERYGVTVLTMNLLDMTADDIMDILNAALYEFPVMEINISLPRWIEELESDHWLRKAMESAIAEAVQGVKKVRDISSIIDSLDMQDDVQQTNLTELNLGRGAASLAVMAQDGLFNQVLSEYAGESIEGEHTILNLMRRYAKGAHQWEKMADAMEAVSEEGYGVVSPQMDELYLEEPELIKQGGHFGVRLKASAPSYHII